MNPDDFTLMVYLQEDPEHFMEIFAELAEHGQHGEAWPVKSIQTVTKGLAMIYQDYQEQLEDVRRDYQYSGGDDKMLFGSLI